MRRIAMYMLLVIGCLAVGGYAPLDDRKGVRAILVYGPPVEGVVVAAEFDAATRLYNEFLRTVINGTELYTWGKLKARPCLGFAVIMQTVANEILPSSALGPEQAAFTYWYYPPMNGEPGVTMTGNIMSSELADALPRYQEEYAKRSEHDRCKWHKGS